MLRQKIGHIDHSHKEIEDSEDTLSILYTQLPDGRLAPIVKGGLVELALSEFEARLVEVSEENTENHRIVLN